MTEELDTLWERWHARPSPATEAALVAAAQPVVRSAVKSLRKLRFAVADQHDLEDLIGMGQVGLLSAIRDGRYDPAKGKFASYVSDRVRSAVRDSVRDEVGPMVKRWSQQQLTELARAEAVLEDRLHRPATDQEVAGYMRVTEDRVAYLRKQAVAVKLVALTPEMDGGRAPDADERVDAGQALDFATMHRLLSEAIEQLSGADRLVITLYYVHGMSMPAIAKEIGIAVSMVSKIRDRALTKVVDAVLG